MRILYSSIVLVAALLCVSCSKNDVGEEYLIRLSRVLDTDIVTQEFPLIEFPTTNQNDAPTKANSISIRSFLGIRHCKLHLTLAHRNSQLGKVASASQRLINDLQILKYGPECIEKLDEGDLKSQLSKFIEDKSRSTPSNLARAILTQKEFKSLWQPQIHIEDYPTQLLSDTLIEDLSFIERFSRKVLRKDYTFSDDEFIQFEQALGKIRHGDLGQLLLELQKNRATLDSANLMIKERLNRQLCISSKPTPKAKHLQNVVDLYFIQGLQSKMILLKRRHNQVFPSIAKLESLLLPYLDIQFERWIESRDKAFNQALNSPKHHVQALLPLYNQCGLNAGVR